MSSPRSVYSMATSQIINKEASQAVEALFETQSITDIKEVETKTRAEIDAKKKQLRSLVGDSYRDVIMSADTILAMNKSCRTVVANIKELKAGLAQLSERAAQRNDVKKEDLRMQRTNQLHAIGGRVKYLVDTPEVIWGFMDTHAYLDAAKRFMQAGEVHRLLAGSLPGELKSRFPLVRGLWPNIEKFRAQLLERVSVRLRQQELSTSREAGLALSAAALLQNLNSEQALELFLDSRCAALSKLLNAGTHGPTDIKTGTGILKESLELIQQCVYQAGRNFLSEHGEENAALMTVLPFEDGATAQLSFLPVRTEDGQEEASKTASLQAAQEELKHRLVALKGDVVAKQVQNFLSKCSKLIREFGGCISATGPDYAELVAEAEKQLRAAITTWQCTDPVAEGGRATPRKGGGLRTPRGAGTPRTPFSPNTPWTPFTRQISGKQPDMPATWPATAEWVLKSPVSLWELLLKPIFEQIEKELIETSFKTLNDQLGETIQSCISMASSQPQDQPGSQRLTGWAGQTTSGGGVLPEGRVQPEAASPQTPPSGRKRPRPEDHESSAGNLSNWRTLLPVIQQDYNEGLRQILRDACVLIDAQEDAVKDPRPRRMSSGKGLTSSSQTISPRGAELQKEVQSCCEKFAENMKARLQSSLPQATEGSSELAGNTIECSILIAQLSLMFAANNSAMAAVLGPPELWESAAAGSSGGQSKTARRRETSKSSFPTIQEAFREIAHHAQFVWAQWVAVSLGTTLEVALKTDASLSASHPLTTWQETIVRQEEEGEGEAEEAKFMLPGMASPHVMLLLLAASRELQRAGGNSPGSAALTALRQLLGQSIASAYRRSLADDSALGKSLSETGALQLLFDTRLLRDFFIGNLLSSRPATSTPAPKMKPEIKEAFSKTSSEFESIEHKLQERLDPIDWAIYAMYLWKGEALFFQRVKVLCGSLLHDNRVHSEVANKSASLTEANVMSLAQTPPRFAYLPVSMPSAPASHGPSVPSMVRHIGIEEESWDSSYSFAGLNSLRSRTNREDAAALSDTASSEMASKGASQRLGVLGTLLGDRAAEVTAMAQQSFNDISLPSAFTNLSGPTSAGGGLFSSLRGLRGVSE